MTASFTSKMFWRRMPAAQRFLRADGEHDEAVHRQSSNRGTPHRTEADNFNLAPAKMQTPRVATGIENGSEFSGARISPKLPRTFVQRARNASQRQIVEAGFTASGNGNYMVKVKDRFLAGLGESAILAAVCRPKHDLTPQLRRNVHAVMTGDRPDGGSANEAAKAYQPFRPDLWPRAFRMASKPGLRPACQARLAAAGERPWAGGISPSRRASRFAVEWTYRLSFSAGQFSRNPAPCPSAVFLNPSRCAGSVSIRG